MFANQGQGLEKIVLGIEPAFDARQGSGVICVRCNVGNNLRHRFAFTGNDNNKPRMDANEREWDPHIRVNSRPFAVK
jgi:hypothetical protein